MAVDKTIYVGPFVHCVSLQEIEICTTGAIGVDESGKIAFVDRDVQVDGYSSQRDEWKGAKLVRISDQGFFFPGFIGSSTLSLCPNDYQC